MSKQNNKDLEFVTTDNELQNIITNILQKDKSSHNKKKKNQPKCGERYITYLEEISDKDIVKPLNPN